MASTEPNMVVVAENEELPQLPELLNIKCLVDDCKELVFKKLDLVDLLNIADSSNQFHPMACQVFKLKYSNRRVTIDQEIGNRNCITSPLITLKLLRNFGHLISDLRINFALFNTDICEKIEDYMTKYCSNSLSFLTLRCNPFKKLFEYTKKPFSNIYSIEMESCCFLRNHIPFDEIFPRLRFLQLDSNRYETRLVINTSIPSLRTLAILKDLDEDEISKVLTLNPQIEKLALVSNYSPTLIRNLNSCLPNLKCLCLRDLPEKFKHDFVEEIHFENLRDFSLGTGKLHTLPFTFCKLEHLSILAHLHMNRKWLNLIGSIANLKSIGLFDVSGNIKDLFDLQNVRLVTEFINICYRGEVSSICLDGFIMHTRPLKKITITSFPPDFQRFVNSLHFNSRCRLTSFPEAKQFSVDFLVFDRQMYD